MLETLGFLLILASLAAYMIASSIEAASALFLFFPKLLPNTDVVARYFQPVWEVTNVFLVFGIVLLFSFFPAALTHLGQHFIVLLLTTFMLAGVRAICLLLIFYAKITSRWVVGVLATVGVWIPIMLASILVYTVYGDPLAPGYLATSWLVSLLIVATIFLLGSTFYQWFDDRTADAAPASSQTQSRYRARHYNEALGQVTDWSLALWIGCIVLLTVNLYHSASYLLSDSQLVSKAVMVLSLAVFMLIITHRTRFPAFAFGNACLTVVVLVFTVAILHLPYLVYPSITLQSAAVSPILMRSLLLSFIAPAIAVAFGLLYLYRSVLLGQNDR